VGWHGQLNVIETDNLAGQEDVARAFYTGVLGLVEEAKPANLQERGGVWFRGGALRLHLAARGETLS
jgi:hypothetical protein